MKKLLIVAHPSPSGHAVTLANVFEQESKNHGHEIDRIDLYDPEFRQDYLVFPGDPDPKQSLMHEKIRWADELVFFFPIWRFDCPAILKNRFDVNFSSWFAYKYKKWSLTPHKLLTWKTARIVATAWGPTWLYYTLGATLLINFAIGRLGYCGIKLRSYTVFGSVRQGIDRDREQELENNIQHIAAR